MEINLSDFPDIRFQRIANAVVFSVPNGGVDTEWKLEIQRPFVALITAINVISGANTNIIANGILIDNQPLNRAALNLGANDYFLSTFPLAQSTTAAGWKVAEIPMRYNIRIIFNNTGVGAQNQTINIWAFVVSDPDKILEAYAAATFTST